MKDKKRKEKKRQRGRSVQELMGIYGFTRYGLATTAGELLFFRVSPVNISVLSASNIDVKTHNLQTALTVMPDLEIVCTDSCECFDANKAYLRQREREERNACVRRLLHQDGEMLTELQAEMSTARQFVFLRRCSGWKPEQVLSLANETHKQLAGAGFEVQRMKKADLQLTRLYFDMPAFHNRLHQELLDELYPTLATTVTPSPYKVTQADIDAALQQWNGRIESKHAVVRYMKAHARDRDTAAWLAREYGLKDTSKPLQISVGNSEPVTLSWAKVQRRIAQLIQSDNFYTEQEQDNFDNIDPIAIREALAERGIVGGRIVDAEANRNSPFIRQVMADVERIAVQEAQAAYMDSPDRFSIRLHPNEGGITGIWDSALDRFYEEGGQVLRFAEQSNAIDYLSSIQRSRGMEPDVPVFTTPLGNAYRMGDGFSSTAAEQRDTLMVVERVDEDNVWYTLPSIPEQETVSVDRTVFERYLDTGYFFAAEQTQPVKEVTAENEQENMIFRAPYAVGDTVYLDNTPFEITEVGALNVQLRDPALRYPVFRAESRENFERLLRRDERNAAITDYLPARNRNDDLRDLLMNGILTPDIRDEVRELFRQGEGNAAIGAYLSNVFAASDADTMTLEDGTEADFITSRSGFQAQVHGEKGVHALGLLWPDAAPVLRAVFLEEAQAQSRTQAQPEPDISLPEQPASEATEPEQPQFTTETVAFYPGEKSHLPYDIEIQTIRTTEPEHDPPAPLRRR